jgi:hypothetical protein
MGYSISDIFVFYSMGNILSFTDNVACVLYCSCSIVGKHIAGNEKKDDNNNNNQSKSTVAIIAIIVITICHNFSSSYFWIGKQHNLNNSKPYFA